MTDKTKLGASFTEGIDFYYNDQGLMVLTQKYHLKRGFCCHSDCLHCPYEEKVDPSVPVEFQMGEKKNEEEVIDESLLKYLDGDFE